MEVEEEEEKMEVEEEKLDVKEEIKGIKLHTPQEVNIS